LPGENARSAGFHPAVSRISNPQTFAKASVSGAFGRLAEWNSAIPQIGNLRHSRTRLRHYDRRAFFLGTDAPFAQAFRL
jgi:hypothetical protein